jgi:hypothetical protein
MTPLSTSSSLDSYVRETRVFAALALLALAAGVVSDALDRHFWTRHPLVANLVASMIVVILSVALVNEVVERRRRRRWRVLAQYVMLELVRHARMVWTGVIELTGLMPSDTFLPASIDAGGRAVRDTSRLTDAIRGLVTDGNRRRLLHAGLSRSVTCSNEVLGRWTDVMLTTDAYARLVDRHVALASDVAWLGSILDQFEPVDDDGRRQRLSQSSPAVQIQGALDDRQLTNRVVSITQLAEELDRGTLEVALRIVPVEWWAARHGWTDPLPSVVRKEQSHA